jgi:hypothetical protein
MYAFSDSLPFIGALKLRQQFGLGLLCLGSLLMAYFIMLTPLGDVSVLGLSEWITDSTIFIIFHLLAFLICIRLGQRWKKQVIIDEGHPKFQKYSATGDTIRWMGIIALMVFFAPLITAGLYENITGNGINDGTVWSVMSIVVCYVATMSSSIFMGTHFGWRSAFPMQVIGTPVAEPSTP